MKKLLLLTSFITSCFAADTAPSITTILKELQDSLSQLQKVPRFPIEDPRLVIHPVPTPPSPDARLPIALFLTGEEIVDPETQARVNRLFTDIIHRPVLDIPALQELSARYPFTRPNQSTFNEVVRITIQRCNTVLRDHLFKSHEYEKMHSRNSHQLWLKFAMDYKEKDLARALFEKLEPDAKRYNELDPGHIGDIPCVSHDFLRRVRKGETAIVLAYFDFEISGVIFQSTWAVKNILINADRLGILNFIPELIRADLVSQRDIESVLRIGSTYRSPELQKILLDAFPRCKETTWLNDQEDTEEEFQRALRGDDDSDVFTYTHDDDSGLFT